MKAAVWYGAKDVRIENLPNIVTPDDKIKVEVKGAGICGSDLHAYYHGIGVSTSPHPISGRSAPLTIGHEFAGVVSEIGKNVKTTLKVGDHVAIEPNIYRSDDPMVAKGKYNLSKDAGFVGLQDDGGFAEYCVLYPHMLHKMPEGMSFEEGAMVEPTAVAYQAVKNSSIEIGNDVAVYGVGPIGLLTIMAAKMAGANQIIAVDISSERLELAKKVGATHIINSMDTNPTEEILKLTGGVDISYECAGAQVTFDSALTVLKSGGELMVIAGYAKPVVFNSNEALVAEKRITTSIGYRNIYPEVIASIASKKLDVSKIITKRIGLSEIIEEGFEALYNEKRQCKIIIDPKK